MVLAVQLRKSQIAFFGDILSSRFVALPLYTIGDLRRYMTNIETDR
jgi:hypothetical protein